MQLEETVDCLYVSVFQQKNKSVTDDKYSILLTLLKLTSIETSCFLQGTDR